MMRRIMAVVVALTMTLPALASAEEPSLLQQIGMKLVRGVANLTTGWAELPKRIYVIGTDEGWTVGAFRGPFDGVGMLFARTLAGAYEIVTFPLPVPPQYRPLLRPEYVWQAEPASPPDK